jgi:hypothetical protein
VAEGFGEGFVVEEDGAVGVIGLGGGFLAVHAVA